MTIQSVMWFEEDKKKCAHAFPVSTAGTVAVTALCGDKTEDDCDERITHFADLSCCQDCLLACMLIPWVRDSPEVKEQLAKLNAQLEAQQERDRAELKAIFEDVKKKAPYVRTVMTSEQITTDMKRFGAMEDVPAQASKPTGRKPRERSRTKTRTIEDIKQEIDEKIRALQASKVAIKATVQKDKQCTVCKNVVFAGRVAMLDPSTLEVRSCARCNTLLKPARWLKCSECGRYIEVQGRKFPYHDKALPMRQVCNGSKKPVKS